MFAHMQNCGVGQQRHVRALWSFLTLGGRPNSVDKMRTEEDARYDAVGLVAWLVPP